ncbi:MAG TPA: hypothetical protein VJJ82_00385 [Candidatus Nanoarchaeia archaeon]|nr:hypothetical protein [Candidatus Nanoarchaeia archaeon]
MMGNDKTITVNLNEELYAKLAQEAAQTYASKASVLRRLISALEIEVPEIEETSQIESKEQKGVFDSLFAGWKNAK